MLNLKCDICGKLITESGALLFSPPIDEKFRVEKFHICKFCYKNKLQRILRYNNILKFKNDSKDL